MTLIRRGKFWSYAFQIDGQRFRGSTKETVKARAAQYEAHLIARVREGGAHAVQKQRPLQLDEWADLFLEKCTGMVASGELSRSTEMYYRMGWRLLSATIIARMRLAHITSDHIAGLTFPGGPSNANCARRTLRRLLRAAVERNRLLKAPRVRTVEEIGRTQLIEQWMEELLLEHAPSPLREVLTVILDAGMRPEEVMRLRRSHLLWDRSMILIATSKTSAASGARYAPLSDRVRLMFAEHEGNSEDAWLFPSRRARGGHLTTITKQWKTCVASANGARLARDLSPLPAGLVPYCGRHTFATSLLEESKNLALVQKTLGHSDVRTTMKYLHPDQTESVDLVNARNRRRAFSVIHRTG